MELVKNNVCAPDGFVAIGKAVGIKKSGNPDLAVIFSEKRANAVKRKLSALGIGGTRIETISYGKEKPIALGHTESDHDQNRRANFVITSK